MTYSWEGHIACAAEGDRLRLGFYATSEQSGEQQHLGGGVAAAGCDEHETAGRAGRAAYTPNETSCRWGWAYLKLASEPNNLVEPPPALALQADRPRSYFSLLV